MTCPTCGRNGQSPLRDYMGSKRKSTNWARYIRTVRSRMGGTQRELAELLGLSESYVCRMERSGWVPSFHTCGEMAARLCMDRREVLAAAGYYDEEVAL